MNTPTTHQDELYAIIEGLIYYPYPETTERQTSRTIDTAKKALISWHAADRLHQRELWEAEAYKKGYIDGGIPKPYDTRVAANCRDVANASVPGTWLDPQTNAKLHNEASVERIALEAKIEELNAIGTAWSTLGSRDYGYAIDGRIAQLQAELNALGGTK